MYTAFFTHMIIVSLLLGSPLGVVRSLSVFKNSLSGTDHFNSFHMTPKTRY